MGCGTGFPGGQPRRSFGLWGLGVAGVFFWFFGKSLSSKSLSRWESVQGVSVPFYELSYTFSPSAGVLVETVLDWLDS